MTQKINIFSEKWCDMVFENKNKEYGAFFLRKITPKNHFVAIIIAFVFFTVAISAPVLFRKMAKKQVEKVLEVTTLSKLKTEEAAPPPPPKDETPVQKQTVAFKPPEVTTENVPDELPPTQEDMNAKPQQIAAVTNVDTLVNLKTTEKPKEIVEADTKVFEFVEQPPEFLGGEEEMMKFLRSNIKYPQMAKESGITGTVYINFVIGRDGRVKDAKVMRGIGGGCDEEALRVVQSMPAWKAGKQNGQAVQCYFNLPVRFSLQ